MKFFIVCPRGLELPLAEELKEISERSEIKSFGAWVIDPPPANSTGGLGWQARCQSLWRLTFIHALPVVAYCK